MKKLCLLVAIVLVSVGVLTACGNITLGSVSNISYSDGVLSFDGVEGAESYKVEIKRADEVVYEDTVTDTSIDVESIGLEGNLEISIVPVAGDVQGEVANYSFSVLSVFEDVVFEAENYLSNFGTGKANSNFRNNPLSHEGAYVGGIDDAGQGVYINYLCPVDGTFDFVAYYCHSGTGASQDVWVNGEYQTKFIYSEDTGWGASGLFNAAESTTQITLKKGWNTISVMKNGDESNNWGDYAELDYFVLKGNGASYNADDLLQYGSAPSYYRLEAEMGSPRKLNPENNMYQCKNAPIVQKEGNKFSNGFIVGGIENNYDGVEWHFNSPVKGVYRVTLAYAAGEFEGSKAARPTFFVTQKEVGLSKSVDFAEKTGITLDPLPYTGWDNIQVATQTIEITLEAGKNFIYCLKLDSADSGIFQIDYIDITLVEEIE